MSFPSQPQLFEQAQTLAQSGKQADAIKILYQGVRHYPDFYAGWLLFSRCLFETGHIKEAVQVAQHADSVDPCKREFQRIQALMQQSKPTDAAEVARNMLVQGCLHPKALFTLGSIALQQQQPEYAIELLAPGIAQYPANMTLQRLIGDAYLQSGQYANAIHSAEALVRLDTRFDNLWRLLGLLFKYGQYEAFLTYCQQAESLAEPLQADIKSQLALLKGQVLRITGKRDDSISALKLSLHYNAKNADAWLALADFKDYLFSAAEAEQLGALIRSHLSEQQRCTAAFAYARLQEQLSTPKESFKHYAAANKLYAASQVQINAIAQEFKHIERSYTAPALSIQAEVNTALPVPVFIVGLPRSGSTLVDQMLASHSQVEGTMEQPTLLAVEQWANRFAQQQYKQPLLSVIDQLTPADLAKIGNRYLEESALFRPNGSRFFTDKQPFNFRLVGLIHKILPQAIIIDVVRNPMDCGLSLYKQYFHSGVNFSYDQNHIGEIYNAYTDLMTYWQNALPGRVYRLEYESLVSNPDLQLTQLLNHIGLAFEPACLAFHNSPRPVHTASSEQVRQPINRNGLGSWLPVADELETLKHSLRSDLYAQSVKSNQ